ncbi:MAG: DUF3179 domain-containing (seleno)protein [Planctomycetota bacterium]
MRLRLGWQSGGWVLWLSALVMVAFVLRIVLVRDRSAGPRIGDGQHVESYAFDLSAFALPRAPLVASPMPRNGVPVLFAPAVIAATEVEGINERERGKYLVSTDRVIGVAIAGEARAYPLRVLNWHEVANDTVGGMPLAVAYHPLCDSAVVFERRVQGHVLEFALSGLLYDSHHLLYDRALEPGRESLWCPLSARAVSGPRVGAELQVLPCFLGPWGVWKERHPETSVLAPRREMLERYQHSPYASYFASDGLHYPVEPQPPFGAERAEAPALKTRIVVVGDGRQRVAVSMPMITRGGEVPGALRRRVGELTLELVQHADPEWVDVKVVAGDAAKLETLYTFWFAWYALHPDTVLGEEGA